MTIRGGNDGLRGPSFVLASVVALVSATSCSGGSSWGGSGLPAAKATPTPPSGQMASAQFVIKWPPKNGTTAARAHYLSNATKSVKITVNGNMPTVVDNPNLSPGATGFTQTTSVTVPAPVGADSFLVDDYDATGGAGNVLAEGSIDATIVAGMVNTISITLSGALAKIACKPVAPFVSGTSSLTLVGPAGQVQLLPEDADSNVIIAPGAVPTLSLNPANGAQASVTADPKTANLFNVNIVAPAGTAVSFTSSGTGLNENAVNGTCTITRRLALYVVNQGVDEQNGSVSIYPASTTTSATPVATLIGADTKFSAIQFVAVDPKGDIFVSNQGPAPGKTESPTSGYVSIFGPGPGSVGNQAPIGSIAGVNRPMGVAFDSKNNLYVLSIDRVTEYPSSADGVTAPAAASSTIVAPTSPAPLPSATLAPNNTDLSACYGLALDSGDNIYTACSNVLNIFPKGSSGNAKPSEIESVGATGMTFSSHSWLAVGVDGSGNIYAPASNNNLNFVEGFAPGSGANPAATPVPSTMAASAGFNQPLGIFVDSNNAFYIGNFGNDTVNAFASKTTLQAGVAGATYTVGVNKPFGVYVR